MSTEKTVSKGDRFADKDPRAEGRVVKVENVFERVIALQRPVLYANVVVDENPSNTSTVGRHSTIKVSTLTSSRYRKLSH